MPSASNKRARTGSGPTLAPTAAAAGAPTAYDRIFDTPTSKARI
eukprot:SAG22_NODE_15765_length_341_cov_0.847107_1_plen_43_part_10